MLANGCAKTRMNKDGGNRITRQWKLIVLSSGEISLQDKVSEDGKQPRARAGQEVRLVDIPCPDSGLLPTLHGFPGGGELSEHIKAQASEHYGHAIRIYLGNLSESLIRRGEVVGKLKTMESDWITQFLPPHAGGQVRRVANRFALVAVAGELGISMGILPWPEGEAMRAAGVCFNAWLNQRGHAGASEDARGVAAVVAFLERNSMCRFDEDVASDHFIPNRAGTRKRSKDIDGWDHFLTTDGWAEATQGFNGASVARACIEAGILEPGAGGKSAQSLKFPGHVKARYHVIRASGLTAFEAKTA